MENNMITISQKEYRKLLKLKIRLDIAQDYLDNTRFTTFEDLITLIGLKENKNEGGQHKWRHYMRSKVSLKN